MQELRQQCSERSPVVAIGKNAGVKMGNHLVRKRDLGLRPLAGAQGHVARRYFGVGALAAGHGAALWLRRSVRARAFVGLCNPNALRLADLGPGRRSARRKVRGAELPYETHGSWSPRRPTLADAQL